MKFPLEAFLRFCSRLTIDSKEQGLVPLRLNGSQRLFIDSIRAGLENDIHSFVSLKSRQLGITTICAALDLFWLAAFPGMQGAFLSNDESNRDMLRASIDFYIANLATRWKPPIKIHNRNHLVLRNRSRLNYIVFGSRRRGDTGAGKGLNFLHATEVASYNDPAGFASLTSSLAERHPRRLFLYESTARGYNDFYQLWQSALRSRTLKPIFIGWWTNEFYSLDPDSALFKVYWDGALTPEEKEWAQYLKKVYQHDITPQQVAWWRSHLHEKKQSDVRFMLQDYPWFPDQAFLASGDRFFSTRLLDDLAAYAQSCKRPKLYHYTIGSDFTQIALHESVEGELAVWEEPIADALYVIGADPAYGSSENSDRFVIEVLRIWADRMEQVAEFATRDITVYGFAWVIAHLAGAYNSAYVNLEINGPGRAVLQELQTLPAQLSRFKEEKKRRALADVFGSMRHYLYCRPDALKPSYAWHWQTTSATKPPILYNLKDVLSRHMLRIASTEWVEEAAFLIQNGNDIRAEQGYNDDRIMAMAIAVEAWRSWGANEAAAAGKLAGAPSEEKARWLVADFLHKMMSEQPHAHL